MTDIFSATPRIFSLPPSTAYLDEVARGLVDATGAKANAEALADALIFTPNQRAARELSVALYRAVGGTLLTPDIRTLGDIEEEDGSAAFGPEALDLPPALSAARRRGALLPKRVRRRAACEEENGDQPNNLPVRADKPWPSASPSLSGRRPCGVN